MEIQTFTAAAYSFLVLGSAVAFLVCLSVNWYDVRRGRLADYLPTLLTGIGGLPCLVAVLVLVAQAALGAAETVHPCSTIEAYSWLWWAGFCWNA